MGSPTFGLQKLQNRNGNLGEHLSFTVEAYGDHFKIAVETYGEHFKNHSVSLRRTLQNRIGNLGERFKITMET